METLPIEIQSVFEQLEGRKDDPSRYNQSDDKVGNYKVRNYNIEFIKSDLIGEG